jgi:hypothetical protein
MRQPASFLDCCKHPSTTAVRVLDESTHDLDSLLRCNTCATFWFYRYHENIDWDGNGDVHLSWWVKLTDAEAIQLRDAPEPHRDDLSFLTARDRWADWDGTVYHVGPVPAEHAHIAWYPPRTGDGSAVIVLPTRQ